MVYKRFNTDHRCKKTFYKDEKRLKTLNKNVSPNLFNLLPNAVPNAVGAVYTERTFAICRNSRLHVLTICLLHDVTAAVSL